MPGNLVGSECSAVTAGSCQPLFGATEFLVWPILGCFVSFHCKLLKNVGLNLANSRQLIFSVSADFFLKVIPVASLLKNLPDPLSH